MSVEPAAADEPILRQRESFEEFYRRERRSLIGLAYVLSGSSRAAEDLAQEAFLAALRRWDEVSRLDDPGAWVRRVLSNRAVSAFRRSVAETKALARLAAGRPNPPIDIPEPSRHVWRAVRSLPRRQAQAVALYYLEDLTIEQVAAVLGCSRSAANTHLRRARARLARLLGEERP